MIHRSSRSIRIWSGARVVNSGEGPKAIISRSKWAKFVTSLSSDESEDIRNIMAASFLRICTKVVEVNKSLSFCKKILFDFLQDENEQIMTSMVDDLGAFIQMFRGESEPESWEDASIADEDEETKGQEPKTSKGI